MAVNRCPRCGVAVRGSRCENCRATSSERPMKKSSRDKWLETAVGKQQTEPEMVSYQPDGSLGVTTKNNWDGVWGESPLTKVWRKIQPAGSEFAINRCVLCGWEVGQNAVCPTCIEFTSGEEGRQAFIDEWTDEMQYTAAFLEGRIKPEPEMTVQDKLDKYGPVVATFQSATKSGVSYEVRYKDSWSCQCSGWKFRKKCRHVEVCERDKITGQVKKDDPLIKAIEEAFLEAGIQWFNVGRAVWAERAPRIAELIRSKLNLSEPFDDTPEEEPFRRIILED